MGMRSGVDWLRRTPRGARAGSRSSAAPRWEASWCVAFGRRPPAPRCGCPRSRASWWAALAGGPVAADGSLLDLLVAGRAAGFAARDAPADSPVAVVALDQRSLLGPELAAYPRALLGPVLAEVLDGVAAAGARVVGFDMIFAYSANRFSRDFDRPFVESLARHRERVVLARSAGSLPAEPFWAAL